MIDVLAHVNIAGMRAGLVYEADPSEPQIAAALRSGFLEDLTPVVPLRRAHPLTPPTLPVHDQGRTSPEDD